MKFTSELLDYTGHIVIPAMTLAQYRAWRNKAQEIDEGRKATEETQADMGLFYGDVPGKAIFINMADLAPAREHITEVELVDSDGVPVTYDDIMDDATLPYPVSVWLILAYREWLGRCLSFFRTSSSDVDIPITGDGKSQ